MTCKTVTAFIRDTTGDSQIELVRGKGYYYFSGGKADQFGEQGVYAVRLREMTKEQWLAEYQYKVSKI